MKQEDDFLEILCVFEVARKQIFLPAADKSTY